jgi:hypothetical protein
MFLKSIIAPRLPIQDLKGSLETSEHALRCPTVRQATGSGSSTPSTVRTACLPLVSNLLIHDPEVSVETECVLRCSAARGLSTRTARTARMRLVSNPHRRLLGNPTPCRP